MCQKVEASAVIASLSWKLKSGFVMALEEESRMHAAPARIVKVKLEILESSIERKQRIRPLELLPITASSGFD